MKIRIRVFLWTILLVLYQISSVPADERIPSLYRLKGIFEEAIAAEKIEPPSDRRITGITVPHHLLAPDLIARGFYLASGNEYDRVVILFPDHFKKARKPFATTQLDFETVFGNLETDRDAVTRLRESCSMIEESDLFAADHGIQALLPFVSHFFPNSKVVPVAMRIDTQEHHWRTLVDALKPLVTEKTLIVQSTDFSHYLPQVLACRRDQETLNILAVGDPKPIERLVQPEHLDSRAAQWVQMVLQSELYEAKPAIIANRNAQYYTPWPIQRSTSYIVQVYETPLDPPRPWPKYGEDQIFFFAGDTFFGRYMIGSLTDPKRSKAILEKILGITAGAPMIVNLEGVMLSQATGEFPRQKLIMPEDLALKWLNSMNVVAVSLANNHALDLGEEGIKRTREALERSGITVLEHGQTHDFRSFRLVALTDLSNNGPAFNKLVTADSLDRLEAEKLEAPAFAFLHWGKEFGRNAEAREEEITMGLRKAGILAVIGCHPHTTGPGIEALVGGAQARVFSLGNFLFDQTDERASGALLEVRIFGQGTYALRWHPVGNLYNHR